MHYQILIIIVNKHHQQNTSQSTRTNKLRPTGNHIVLVRVNYIVLHYQILIIVINTE